MRTMAKRSMILRCNTIKKHMKDMHKRLLSVFLFLAVAAAAFAGQKAKYVFYLITDGTGVNTVLGAEMMQAELQGQIGRKAFCMTQLPVVGVASTFSYNSGVTDSAASGTALATGVKTNNGAVGVYPDLETPASSIAVWAKQAGIKVGVASSVPVNHATPAAFYAHDASRNDYYAVARDMIESGLDFYAGAEIKNFVDKKKHPGEPDLYKEMERAGYVVARGVADFKRKYAGASKMLLVQDSDNLSEVSGSFSIPYAIDKKPGDMTPEDILRCQIEFLTKDSDKGFFLMNEIGGKVDWACHARDGATAFAEVAAVDRCVAIAYEFYKQHPDETLIILTADHETGGLVLAADNIYSLNLQVLQHQAGSLDAFSAKLRAMRKDANGAVTWEMAQQALSEHFGFWSKIEMTDEETTALKEVWQKSFGEGMADVKNEYTANHALADKARSIINAKANIQWATRGHSAGLVPVYACGVGSEKFIGHNDNATIPLKIAEAAGYNVPETLKKNK